MDTFGRSRNQRLRTGFIAGLLAGVVATGVMLLVSVVWNGISLPEVFGSELTALMPPPLFNFLHGAIGGDAKHYLFYGIVVGQCLVFGLSGALYNLEYRLAVSTTTEAAKAIDKRPYYQRLLSLGRNTLRGLRGHTCPPDRVPQGSPPSSTQLPPLRWYDGLVLALILWLLVGFGLLPLTGAGIFGAHLTIGFVNGMLSLALVGVVFGLLFVSIRNWLTAQAAVPVGAGRKEPVGAGVERKGGSGVDEERGSLPPPVVGETRSINLHSTAPARGVVSRRALLRRGVILAGVGLLGVGLWRFITEGVTSPSIPVSRLMQNFKSKIVPPPIPDYGVVHPAPFLSPEVTSNDQYYIVSKNLFADPAVDGNSWKLVVDGKVDHPFALTYQQVLALPMQQQYESMMCISNEVGGEYMSNALWEGVPLKDLLQRAGVKAGATKVIFYAVDDYSDSIHLSKALEPTTLVAVRMNGVTLPDSHGFPARMLVPGIYGMKHCKWLTRIEVVNYDYQGYWQKRGWSDAAPIRLTARIDTPLDGSTAAANRPTFIAGVAFSGNRGISEVDVSTDGGQTWQVATLKRPLSALTWVLWELEWRPEPGSYMVIARAIDLGGNVQDPIVAPPLPDGSSGYHTINVTVS